MTVGVSSKLKWKDFFTRYYKPKIQQLAVSDAKHKSLEVSYSDLLNFDVRLYEEFIQNPDKVIKDAEDAIPLVDIPVKRKLSAFVRFVKLPRKTSIRDLRIDHINTFVSIDCMVRNITKVKPRITIGAFECARCGNMVYLPQEGSGKFLKPSYCSCNEEKKGVFRLVYKECTFEDYQLIKIQEAIEDTEGKQPETIDCNLNNDLVGTFYPGDRIIINGILRSVQDVNRDGQTIYFGLYVDVNGVERDQELDDLVITGEDEEKIRKLARRDDVYEVLEKSIAPSIYGHLHVKRALGLQMFGSPAVILSDGTRKRGDPHILWLGDPAVAKSQVLAWVSKNAPRAVMTSGNATGAGLVAATVKDEFKDGSFSLEAGTMALASRGICIIDEFDKMRRDDRVKIHPAMEQQRVPIDRAGIHATVITECSVLAAGNPKLGRFDPEGNIPEQIDLDPTIMSRFDLAFMSYDTPDEKRDREISTRILKADKNPESITPEVDPLLLKKWIVHSKRNIRPVCPDNVDDMIQAYYLKLRKASEKSTIKITARNLDGLKRFCKAAARVTLSPTVEERHVKIVLELFDRSVRDTCIDENGEVDVDILTVGMGKSQRKRLKTITDIVRDLCGKDKTPVKVDRVVAKCVDDGMQEDTVRKELKRLKEIGDVYMLPGDSEVGIS